MSQSGYTPIQLYRTSTASATPSAGNLADGELAINTADGKLFYKDSGGVVQTIANKNNNGTVTSVAISGGTTGLTASGSPITTSGTITFGGILAPASGGTGVANGANNTITFTGNFSLGLTLTGNTSVTMPTSGAIATKGNAIAFSIVFGL